MNKIKNLVAIFCAVACVSSAYSAGFQPSSSSSSASTQATATLTAVCTIQAQNLSLGNIVMPLSAQGASSSMTVLCSKNAPYTIGLSYGGVYGSGSGGSSENLVFGSSSADSTYTNRTCNYVLPSDLNIVITSTTIPANQSCSMSMTYQAGGYSYGKMIGVISGDSIAYSIQVPNNPGQVWNAGEASYSSTGTGSNQSIPVVLSIVPAQSSGNYPSPDTYMDTVTATISY